MQQLQILEFKRGGQQALTIAADAFYRTSNITTLRLPARLAEMNMLALDGFTKLTVLEMEEGGTVSYWSVLFNATDFNAYRARILHYIPENAPDEWFRMRDIVDQK